MTTKWMLCGILMTSADKEEEEEENGVAGTEIKCCLVMTVVMTINTG